MTLDLGTLGFKISVDTSTLETGLDSAKKQIDGVDKQLDKAGKKKLAPSTDTRNVEKLGAALDEAAKAADKVSGRKIAPVADTRGVSELAGGLEQAGKAAGSLNVPTGFTSGLASAAEKARELGRSLSEAGQGGGIAGQLAKAGGAVKGLVPAVTAATTATAMFTKGWDRLSSLEGARATLTGLGNDANAVAAIMADANTAVKGTAFGMGEAAKTAANAVAAGAKPGAELAQVLTTVADTAAISGDSIQDMGLIFNSVMARGVLKGDDMMQLLGRGIPVLQLVGKEMGVTAAEVSDMVSKGQVDFATFEAAMRNQMGGAAQEAGNTVKGSLANVGAALGRFGADTMEGGFALLPGILNSISSGIDAVGAVAAPVFSATAAGAELVATGVKGVVDVFNALPGPVKTAAGGIVAARIALAALNTEAGKAAFGKVASAVSAAGVSMRTFAASTAATTAQLRAANPGMTMFGASLRAVATNAGIATGAMGLMRTAGASLLTLLGGPLGIAIMGAGAAVGLLVGHFQKQRQAAQEAEQATQQWADTLAQSGGRVNESVQSMVLAEVQSRELSDAFKETGTTAADMTRAITDQASYDAYVKKLDDMRAGLQDVDQSSAEARRSVQRKAIAIAEQKEALEELHPQFAEASDRAREMAQAQEELNTSVDKTPGKFDQVNGVFAALKEDAKSADDAISNLANSMLGLSDDPAIRLQSYLDKSAKSVQELGKMVGEGMPEMDMATGQFDKWDEKGRNLNSTFATFRTTLAEVTSAAYVTATDAGESHVVAAEKARAAAEEFTNSLTDQMRAAGMTKDKIKKLSEVYLSVPEEVMTQFSTAGGETAQALVEGIKLDLASLNDDATVITMDASALDIADEKLEELGFKKEDLGNGAIKLTADSEVAEAALSDLAAKKDQLGIGTTMHLRADVEDATAKLNDLGQFKARFNTEPASLGVVADTVQASKVLDDMKKSYRVIDGYIHIKDNTSEVEKRLADAGTKVAQLPEGYITIKDDTGKAKDALTALGLQVTELPNGEVAILDNVSDVQTKLGELKGIVEQYDAKTVIEFLADTTEFTGSADEIAQRINELDQSGATPLVGADIEEYLAQDHTVREAILALSAERAIPIADLNPDEFNTKKAGADAELDAFNKRTATAKIDADDKQARGVIGRFWDWVQGLFSRPVTAQVNARQGHLHGGVVGRLAEGGMPGASLRYGSSGGYILPTSGAGTAREDGILGVGRDMTPTAWVNRGEFVVNEGATRRFEPVLWSLNSNDPHSAMEALAGQLEGYAEGGKVTAPEVLAFVKGQRVNGQQASRSLEGALYDFGGSNWGDCSSTAGQIALFGADRPATGGRFMSTANEETQLASLGATSGFGGSGPRLEFGWLNGGPGGGHTSTTLYFGDGSSVNLEMGGGRGNGQIGGAAAGARHSQYTHGATLPLAGGDGEALSTSVDGVTVGKGGKTRTVDWGEAGQAASVWDKQHHRSKQLARYDAGIFDTGGMLGHNSAAFNFSGRNEAVLNPIQTDGYQRIGKVAPRLADAMEKQAEVTPEATAAMRDLGTWAQKVVEASQRGDRAGLLEMGWQQTQQANRALSQMPADAPDFDRWAQMVNRTAGEALMGAVTMEAGQWVDMADKIGVPLIGEFSGVAAAHENLQDSMVAQVDAVDALAEAHENLKEAQADLAEAMSAEGGLSDSMKRKLEDAEEGVAKARKGGKADQIAKAEKKLSRVREDAAKELEKNGAKNAEEVKQAKQAVKDAEKDVGKAGGVIKQAAAMTGQAHIAMAVEAATAIYKIGKQIIGKIIEWVRFERQVVVGFHEAIADGAGYVRDLAVETEKQRSAVGRFAAEVVNMQLNLIESAWKLRIAQDDVAQAQLQGVVRVATAQEALSQEEDRLANKRRYHFSDMSIMYDDLVDNVHIGLDDIVRAQQNSTARQMGSLGQLNDMSEAGLQRRISGEATTTRKQAEALAERWTADKDMSDREKALVADLFQGRFAGFDREKASIEEQRAFADAYRAAEKAGLKGLVEDATKSSAKTLELQALVHAADWEAQENIYAAQLAQLEASEQLRSSSAALTRSLEDAAEATARLKRLDGANTGMSAESAVLTAEIARIMAENAQHDATMANSTNKIGYALDRNKNGKWNPGSRRYMAAMAGKEANEKQLAELQQRFIDATGQALPELTAEDREKFALAGRMKAKGETEQAEQIIRSTQFGAALLAMELGKIDDTLAGIRKERRDSERAREDAYARRDYLAESLPLQAQKYGAQRMRESWQAESAGMTARTQTLADAQRALAEGSRRQAFAAAQNAQALANLVGKTGDRRPTRQVLNVTIDGDAYSAETVEAMWKQVGEKLDGVEVDVRRIEQALTPGGAKQTALSRAGIRVR